MKRTEFPDNIPTVTDESNPRIAWLFKDGRRERLEAGRSQGLPFPREFFYGFTEVCDGTPRPALIEERDLAGGRREGWIVRVATVATFAVAGINAYFLANCLRPENLDRLNRFDVLVATTNNQVNTLALLRRLGRLKARVLGLVMGVAPRDARRLRRTVTRRILREVSLAPISRGEETHLGTWLDPGQDLAYLPFGVDHAFWVPGEAETAGDGYVLSIGNDSGRDYATLVEAWRPEFPLLKIVTRRPVPVAAANVEVIAGDWNRRLLGDDDVRRLVQGARFVVLPLRETIQPAGQSACLQAMACGRTVVMTRVSGLWDSDVMVDGKTCVLIPPASAADLRTAVEGLLAEPDRLVEIGRNARKAVETHFNLDIMAAALKSRIEKLL